MMETAKGLLQIVSYVVTFVVAIYGLYRWIRTKTRLELTVFELRTQFPNDSEKKIHEFAMNLRQLEFRAERLNEIADSANGTEDSGFRKYASRSADLLEAGTAVIKSIPDVVVGKYGAGLLFKSDRVWDCQITNRSTMEAKSLTLALPCRGKVEIRRDGATEPLKDFDQVIEIGNLRAKAKIHVIGWTSDLVYGNEEIHLTHSGGVVKARNGKVAYSRVAKAIETGDWKSLAVMAFLLSLIMSSAVVGIYSEYHSHPATQPATQP